MELGANGSYDPAKQYDQQVQSRMRNIIGTIEQFRKIDELDDLRFADMNKSGVENQTARLQMRNRIGSLIDEATSLEGFAWTVPLAVGRKESHDVDVFNLPEYLTDMRLKYQLHMPSIRDAIRNNS